MLYLQELSDWGQMGYFDNPSGGPKKPVSAALLISGLQVRVLWGVLLCLARARRRILVRADA
jgi:hypothetical protein